LQSELATLKKENKGLKSQVKLLQSNDQHQFSLAVSEIEKKVEKLTQQTEGGSLGDHEQMIFRSLFG
jgi:cell division protein FtsB